MKKYGNIIIKLTVVLVLLFLDLWTKSIMQGLHNNGVLDPSGIEVIPNFFYLRYQSNEGAAFSMLGGQTIFLIGFSAVMLVVMMVIDWKMPTKNKWFFIGVILFYAGGIGNLIDRLAYHYVRDFVYFTFFPTVFNLADTFLVVGVICIAIYLLFYHTKEQKQAVVENEDQKMLDQKETILDGDRVVEKSQYTKEDHKETMNGESDHRGE